MGKTPDFDDWKWPWKQGEVDEEKAARMIWKLKKGFEDMEDKVKGKDDEIAQLETDLDTAKAAKSGTDEDAQAEIEALRKQVRDLEKNSGKTRPEDQQTIDQLKVALELGLDLKDAERLRGKDFDEMLEDGKDFAERHGIEVPGDGEDGGGDPSGPQQQPATNFRTQLTGGGKVTVAPDPRGAAKSLPPLN